MKLIRTLHKFKIQFLTKLPNIDICFKAFIQLSAITCIAAVIWFTGPLIAWNNHFPLVQAEKRFYIILFLLLTWLLKFLILDLDAPNPFQHSDPEIRKSLQALHSRIRGVLEFLKQTTINKHDPSARLNQLPWYLLVGPANAGKTTLLANSKVHFILQRQFQSQPTQNQNISPSENCDWWITRDASIIDVPGKYMYEKTGGYSIVWKTFLRLIKKICGKNVLNGIIITLPLPEIMKQGDPKKYQNILRDLFLRIKELQTSFPQRLPCYLVITKCDLLSGFNEFFAESSDDEIAQAWGLTLPQMKGGEKTYDVFTERFNSLIKKLNQQLLWRLHQERNPMARPYIKDFPLQVERLKECTLDFVKKFLGANLSLSLQGMYLTSAQQNTTQPETTVVEAPNTTQRAMQLFKEPTATSRAYFIKQFITQGLISAKDNYIPAKLVSPWRRRTAYAASIAVIGLAAIIFGKDFEIGIKQAYAIQNTLSDYHLAIQQLQDPDEHLIKTLALLNTLQQTAKNPGYKLDVLHILTFYSNKSKQKSNVVYHQALQNILIPELKNYLGEYLKNPVNKNTEYVYAALKSYLMLGDTAHFQPDFIVNTTRSILPKAIADADATQLISHVNVALNASWNPLTLDTTLIQDARRYLISLPSFQLGYIILKNINNNNLENEINLGTNNNLNAFVNHQILNQVPQMFTAKEFPNIISQEMMIAAQESVMGNWILGNDFVQNNNPDTLAALLQQLRNTYINNYVDVWESLLANIHLSKPKDLAQTDTMIITLISNDSPLLQLLQTLHDNTYFEPIASSSPKLQNLGLLVDKNNQSNNMLYQIFSGLQALHQYLHAVLIAENERKAAFEVVSARMQHVGELDSITQLHLIAEKSPEPIKNWLEKIANDAWRFLLQDASHYIDTSWQEQVGHFYQAEIANRYPFNANAAQEVELNKFTDFFGNPGMIVGFYDKYLVPFIDTSTAEWRWKSIDNQKLPFSEDTLRQLQYAMRIHRMFFPNGDNKINVQFSLQPYSLSKFIKRVKLNINDKKIIDQHADAYNTHSLVWPNKYETKMTSVQFTMLNQKTKNRAFPGDWGWFKLVNQSFISSMSHKAMLLNLSENNYPVKYLLFTKGQYNPFLSLNLQNLHLPQQLIETEKLHA